MGSLNYKVGENVRFVSIKLSNHELMVLGCCLFFSSKTVRSVFYRQFSLLSGDGHFRVLPERSIISGLETFKKKTLRESRNEEHYCKPCFVLFFPPEVVS